MACAVVGEDEHVKGLGEGRRLICCAARCPQDPPVLATGAAKGFTGGGAKILDPTSAAGFATGSPGAMSTAKPGNSDARLNAIACAGEELAKG